MSERFPRVKNRELLRWAGEHLGTLAEQAKESMELTARNGKPSSLRWNEYAKLRRLSTELLELAKDRP